MSEKQWVQHISGQGKKWEVIKETPFDDFCVQSSRCTTQHYLPKSEYRLCEPPEVWKDVSEGARVGSGLSCILYDNLGREISVQNGYRLRKVGLWQSNGLDGKNCPVAAFIVEQKVSQ